MTVERASSFDRWQLYSVVPGTWALRKPVLVPVHGFCWPESVSSGFTNWCPMMTFLRKLGVGQIGEN